MTRAVSPRWYDDLYQHLEPIMGVRQGKVLFTDSRYFGDEHGLITFWLGEWPEPRRKDHLLVPGMNWLIAEVGPEEANFFGWRIDVVGWPPVTAAQR